MNMTRLSVAFIACLPFGGTLSLLRGQSPSPSVDQQLHSQYRVASVDGNGRVVRPGSVLVVAQDGIKANPPSRAGCWYNSHKPGDRIKYSTLFEVTVPADLRNQVRLLQVGEKVMVISLVVKSEVTFCVQTYTGNPDDPPYRAGLVFQFPQKNYVQPANLKAIQDSITEVFSIDTSTSSEPSMPAPGEQQGKTNAGQGGQTASVVGLYVAPGGRQLQLNPDGSFSARGAGSPTTAGHFAVNGDALVLTFPADGRSSTLRIHDDRFTTLADRWPFGKVI